MHLPYKTKFFFRSSAFDWWLYLLLQPSAYSVKNKADSAWIAKSVLWIFMFLTPLGLTVFLYFFVQLLSCQSRAFFLLKRKANYNALKYSLKIITHKIPQEYQGTDTPIFRRVCTHHSRLRYDCLPGRYSPDADSLVYPVWEYAPRLYKYCQKRE